uniref:Cytochrome c oxidase subunit 3 n=1 Tax=Gasteruption parvicollarium TaxID=1738629 RepID=A0A2S0B0Y7_9HYME|nr:cytochrome c oxidase subunit III [Gasteruption parvicollarium]ALJ93743.1 cytochrome c oxidase subunit III [Gasteruption parvicollarium]
MTKSNFPFHMVSQSPWPILTSMSLMVMLMGSSIFFSYSNSIILFIGISSTILCMYQWWRDIIRESTYQGFHTKLVCKGIKTGMILFIISEIFFFISFFWAYFHMFLTPNIEIGMMWPPKGIKQFNPMSIPLLNTILLISSGISITWSHHSILNNMKNKSILSLMLTIMLGIYFSLIQYYEYLSAPFCISDSSYGSIFFMLTGFHGIHVLIGTTFLIICLYFNKNNHLNMNHHLSFELSSWYWHFVDVVWLFLYILIYWWNF